MRARTIGSRHRRLLIEGEESGKGCVALVVDGHSECRGLDRGCARDRLDARLGPAVGETEGEPAKGRVGSECNADLLEESIEGSGARRGITLLDVDLDLDRMLVTDVPEATERLLGFTRIAVAQDDQPAV